MSCGVWCVARSDIEADNRVLSVEDEFNRTTSCVRGGLPMEIQFSLPDSPRKAKGDTLTLEMVDDVLEKLDGKVKLLLSQSARAVWNRSGSTEGTAGFHAGSIKALTDEFLGEVAERAPETLGVDFCGSRDDVGSAAEAAILDYFGRALTLEGGSNPNWIVSMSDPSRGQSILMFAAGLRASLIKFDPKSLTN
jgi:hypothetical protein